VISDIVNFNYDDLFELRYDLWLSIKS